MTQSTTLPEDDPEAFEAFVEWLYRGTFFTVLGPLWPTEVLDKQSTKLFQIYILAMKYGVTELADRSTTGFIQHMLLNNRAVNLGFMGRAYDQTTSSSKIRLFIAKSAAFVLLTWKDGHGKGQWDCNEFNKAFENHSDLMLDVLKLLRHQAGKSIPCPKLAPNCDYHEHSKTDICPYPKRDAMAGIYEA